MKKTLTTVAGSLADTAEKGGQSLAETFLGADAIVICDTSGSMGAHDSQGGRKRYDVLLEELGHLQASQPGKLAVIAFSNFAQFIPGGQPPFLCAGTNLAGALEFARVADVDGMKFFVISDGLPNSGEKALAEARKYKGTISCIFVGPEGGSGQKFLEKLARSAGGRFATAEAVKELAATAERLMLEG